MREGRNASEREQGAARLRRLVRRFVVVTAFPPFGSVYRGIYRFVLWFTVRRLRRFPGIRAIYLRRGAAKGEWTPGISDIDLGVVAENDAAEIARFTGVFERIARWIPLLDRPLEVYTTDELRCLPQSHYRDQYRLTEGKATWRLLYGTDRLQSLPPLTATQVAGGCYSEMNMWWALFAEQALQPSHAQRDLIARNAICYKAVAEMVKMNLALQTGQLIFARREGLERGLPLLTEEEQAFVRRLQTLAERRYLGGAALSDETLPFLLRFLNRFHGAFRAHPFVQPLNCFPPTVDCPASEWFRSQPEEAHSADLLRYLQEQWAGRYRSLYLLPGLCWRLDDLLFVIEAEPERLPDREQVARLIRFHAEAQTHLKRHLYLFLLLPETAFQLTTEPIVKRRRSLLFAPFMPEVFLLMSRPEFVLQGVPWPAPPESGWTHYQEQYLGRWKTHPHWRDCAALWNEPSPALPGHEFLRRFWKSAQLIAITRSLRSGNPVLPLTLPAVRRALAREGVPLPESLLPLADAFIAELAGTPQNIGARIPTALAYLSEIEA